MKPKLAYPEITFSVGERSSSMPEHRLMFAVLRRSIYDYVLYKNLPPTDDRNEYAVEAEAWLFEGADEEGSSELYTFEYVCEELGLFPEYARKIIRGLKRGDLKEFNQKLRDP